MLTYESQLWDTGCRFLAGVDEAGRGPLAGPVVAAAVVFNPEFLQREWQSSLARLTDSKQLTEPQRRTYYDLLYRSDQVAIGVGCISAREIDRINVLQATHQAMRQALGNLPSLPQHALIDGLPVPNLPCSATAIVKGDARSLSIAAASVIAKVTRDDIMLSMDEQYPVYGFARHKGYGTHAHVQALLRHGPCPEHRRSFRPVHDTESIRVRLKHPATEPYVEDNPRMPGRGAARRKLRQMFLGLVG